MFVYMHRESLGFGKAMKLKTNGAFGHLPKASDKSKSRYLKPLRNGCGLIDFSVF